MLYSEVSLADLGLTTVDLLAHRGLITIDLMANSSGLSGISLDYLYTRSIMAVDMITPVYSSIQSIFCI
jgi:hypothetical protein